MTVLLKEAGEEVEGVGLRIVVFDTLRFGQPEHRADRILVIPGHVADVPHNGDDFEFTGVLEYGSCRSASRIGFWVKSCAKGNPLRSVVACLS
jgi:hypothetical protein